VAIALKALGDFRCPLAIDPIVHARGERGA